jgi:hypothetical protein
VVLWIGFGRDRDLCAVWWLDPTRRKVASGLAIKPPWCPPLYAEDYGHHRPLLKLFGWRVLPVPREA